MRAGVKDRLIVIERKTVTTNSVGEPIETWAAIEPTSGFHAQRVEGPRVAESYAAHQLAATISTIFNVGFFPAYDVIRPDTHRVNYRGRIYNILGAFELGRKRGVQIACEARAE